MVIEIWFVEHSKHTRFWKKNQVQKRVAVRFLAPMLSEYVKCLLECHPRPPVGEAGESGDPYFANPTRLPTFPEGITS